MQELQRKSPVSIFMATLMYPCLVHFSSIGIEASKTVKFYANLSAVLFQHCWFWLPVPLPIKITYAFAISEWDLGREEVNFIILSKIAS